jgi:hypothetical protein
MKMVSMKGVLEVRGQEAGKFEMVEGALILKLVVPPGFTAESLVIGVEALLSGAVPTGIDPNPPAPLPSPAATAAAVEAKRQAATIDASKPGALEAAIEKGKSELKAERAKAAPAAEKGAGKAETPAKEAETPAPPKSAPRAVSAAPAADPDDDIPFGKDEDPAVAAATETDGNADWGFLDAPPVEITEAKKVSAVVKFLWDKGLRTDDQFVDACEKLRDHCPALKALTNLRDRVVTSVEIRRGKAAEGG